MRQLRKLWRRSARSRDPELLELKALLTKKSPAAGGAEHYADTVSRPQLLAKTTPGTQGRLSGKQTLPNLWRTQAVGRGPSRGLQWVQRRRTLRRQWLCRGQLIGHKRVCIGQAACLLAHVHVQLELRASCDEDSSDEQEDKTPAAHGDASGSGAVDIAENEQLVAGKGSEESHVCNTRVLLRI